MGTLVGDLMGMIRTFKAALSALTIVSVGISGFPKTSLAQTTNDATSAAPASDGLQIELNKATDANGNCRLVFVAKNDSGQSLDQTAYEVVIFGDDGGVLQFLVLQFGRYPANKTRVVRFDVENQSCSGISRLLVNDVDACVSNGQPSEVCLEGLTTSSRTDISFDQ